MMMISVTLSSIAVRWITLWTTVSWMQVSYTGTQWEKITGNSNGLSVSIMTEHLGQNCCTFKAHPTRNLFFRFLQTPVVNRSCVSAERSVCAPHGSFNSTDIADDAAADEAEEFHPVRPADGGSPFSTMVGDCERPSLAITPHTKRGISMLKVSLRRQLESLYD